MNTESVNLRRVPYPLPIGFDLQPGDFSWSNEEIAGVRYLYLRLPGENRMEAIRVRRGQGIGPREWGWDGNEDKPTLTPSIHAPGVWHGFLIGGRLNSC